MSLLRLSQHLRQGLGAAGEFFDIHSQLLEHGEEEAAHRIFFRFHFLAFSTFYSVSRTDWRYCCRVS